jgi:C-terminal processing protease CtpA/Prc
MNGETLSRVLQVFRQSPLSPRVIYVIYDAQQHTAAAGQVIHTQMISGADEGKSKLPHTTGAKKDTTVADLAGIGIAFGRNDSEDETSALFILLVHPNGPAARTGHLEAMQELISVDAWPVYRQDLATIAQHVRGPVGTHVILEVLTLASKGRQILKVAVAREHTTYSGPTAPVPCQGGPSDPSSRLAEAEADTRAALVAQIPQVLASDTTASCVLQGLLDKRDLKEATALEEEAAVLEEAEELLQQAKQGSTCTTAPVGTFRKDDLPEATQERSEAVNHFSRALSVEMTPLYRGQRLIIESLSSCSPKASCGIPSPPEEATVLEQACTLTQVAKMTDMAETAGIGIRFGRNEDGLETSAVFILFVHPNGPAAQTGHFEPMQELISVDGWPVCGHDLATIAQHVKGPVGTHVILEVLTLASKGRQTLKVAVAREHTAYSGPTDPIPFQGRPLDPSERVAEAEADTRAALDVQIPQVLSSDTPVSCVLLRLLEERDLKEASVFELDEAMVSLILPPIPEDAPSRACSDASQACTLTQVANLPSLAGIAGIGIRFGYSEDDSESSPVFILVVHPNGPAARTGHLEPMQELISVDGWSVYGQDLATIAQHVRGPVGTHVILEVLTLASKGRQTLKVAVAREHTPGVTPHLLPTSVLVPPSQL